MKEKISEMIKQLQGLYEENKSNYSESDEKVKAQTLHIKFILEVLLYHLQILKNVKK